MSEPATSAPHTGLHCRIITELASWQRLEPIWDLLLKASPDHTPWQSYAFLVAWWKHLSAKMVLRVFVVERDGIPCLVMPLQISKLRGIPGFPVRLLEPVGMIMDVNRPRLALGSFDQDAYHCAFEAIWKRNDEWDVLRIDEKAWDDSEVALLRDFALARTCIFRQAFSHLVPYLDLNQTWTEYLRDKSQKMRKNIKTARRKLEQLGNVELRRFQTESEVREGLAVFVRLSLLSWKQKKKVEQSQSSEYRIFFAEWLEAMARHDACTILALYCNDDPVAATIAFTDDDTYYSAQIVHDDRFSACSPGTLLESMELESLMAERRFTRYEFLGSFLNNKLRWTATASNTAMVLVFQRSIRTFIMDIYYSFLKPYLRPTIVRVYKKFFPKEKR